MKNLLITSTLKFLRLALNFLLISPLFLTNLQSADPTLTAQIPESRIFMDRLTELPPVEQGMPLDCFVAYQFLDSASKELTSQEVTDFFSKCKP